jgi:MFS family permease
MALTTVSVVSMDSLAVPIALDQSGTGAQVSLALLEWTLIAYSLAFAALVPVACTLYAAHGSRRILRLGQAMLAAASVGCALAPVGPWLVLGRTAQGAAAALVVPAVLKRAGRISSPRISGLVLPGCAGGVIELSAAAGPLVCAAVAEGEDWRWIFWLNVPVCLLSLALAPAWDEDRRRVPRRPDLEGALVAGLGSFALAWGVTEGASRGWGNASVLLGLVLGAGLLLVSFYGRRPLGGFRATEFLATRVGYACGCAGLYCMVLLLQRYFLAMDPAGRPLEAWLHLAPLCLGLLVCAPLSDPLALRVGTSRLMSLGLTTTAAALGALAWGAHQGASYDRLLLPLLLSGSGIALALPAGRTLALVVPAKSVPGGGPASVGALRNLGGAFGVAAVGAVLTYRSSDSAPHAPNGLAPAIALVGLICLAGAATHFAVPSRNSPI